MMRLNTRRILTRSWRNRTLRFLMVLLAGIMIVDTGAWVMNGNLARGMTCLLWILNIVNSGAVCFASYLWYLYAYDFMQNGIGQCRRKAFIPAIPLLAFLAVLLSDPWHHMLFYLDAHNRYMRGPIFWIQTVVPAGYLAVASVMAFNRSRAEHTSERRQQLRMLAAFIILPFAGSCLQLCFYGMDLALPFTAASLLMIYFNAQREQVTRDGLTGLNNRRRLDQYLQTLDEQAAEAEGSYFILMDVNKFKEINDTFGHITGDEVLREVAAQIKVVFGNTRAFLARYGGDEFVIVIRCEEPQEVWAMINRLKESIRKIEWADGRPWEITVSVGCAAYERGVMHSTREALEKADEHMYWQKRQRSGRT